MGLSTVWPVVSCARAQRGFAHVVPMLDGCMDLSGRPSNPNVAALASALLERLPQFADEATERICQQVEAYRQEQPVPRDDLFGRAGRTWSSGFAAWPMSPTRSVGAAPHGSPPRRAGRAVGDGAQRVSDRIRLHVGLRGDRGRTLGFGAGNRAGANRVGCLDAQRDVHHRDGHGVSRRDDRADPATDQERSALVEALVSGSVADTATVWEAADLLALPYRGLFVVVAAEPPTLARHALPNIESRLRDRGIGSAWRLLPDLHVGIVSLRTSDMLQTHR